ncbi:MAG: hypothetical protein ACXU8A_11620 [Burkholderiaceae bacterium]
MYFVQGSYILMITMLNRLCFVAHQHQGNFPPKSDFASALPSCSEQDETRRGRGIITVSVLTRSFAAEIGRLLPQLPSRHADFTGL